MSWRLPSDSLLLLFPGPVGGTAVLRQPAFLASRNNPRTSCDGLLHGWPAYADRILEPSGGLSCATNSVQVDRNVHVVAGDLVVNKPGRAAALHRSGCDHAHRLRAQV